MPQPRRSRIATAEGETPMAELTVCTHAEAAAMHGDIVPTLTDLVNIAFGEYEGCMEMSVDFMRWYLRRPGTDPSLCQVVMDGERAAANVFVAVHTLGFCGTPLRCGIIDSVSTLPEYRRQGLARGLMDRAHEAMRAAEIDMSVLYTNPDGHPYGFYQRLGYKTRSWIDLLAGARPDAVPGIEVSLASETDYPDIRTLIDSVAPHFDGAPELTDDYWRWHKIERPADSPVTILAARATPDGPILGTVTFCDSDLAFGDERVRVSTLADLVLSDDAGDDVGAALLSAASQPMIAVLCDMIDPAYSLFIESRFQRQVCEVSMLLPFTWAAQSIAAEPPAPWHTLVESVIGV